MTNKEDQDLEEVLLPHDQVRPVSKLNQKKPVKPVKKAPVIKRHGTAPEAQTKLTGPVQLEQSLVKEIFEDNDADSSGMGKVALESLQSVEDFRAMADPLIKDLDEVTVNKLQSSFQLANDLTMAERLIGIRTYAYSRLNDSNVDRASIKVFNPMVAKLDKKIAVLLGSDEFAKFLDTEK